MARLPDVDGLFDGRHFDREIIVLCVRSTRQHFFHGFTQLHLDIAKIRKPTIAMINGPAVGSGMDMALPCDIRIGCDRTRFIGYHNVGSRTAGPS